jgi:hypothetical protein
VRVTGTRDHVTANRAALDVIAAKYEEPERQAWASTEPWWGSTSRHAFVTLESSRRWPCEEVWKARKARS